MKKYLLLVIVILVAVLLAIPTPAFADEPSPVGSRINLFTAESTTFDANTPFHIRHGWIQASTDGAIGVFDFQLEVDGVLRKVDIRMFSAVSGDPDILTRLWVYNFPQGMNGTHTFTGHYYAPCQYAVDYLDYPGPCSSPSEKVQTNTKTLTVTFTP